jgi:hypothetical protein
MTASIPGLVSPAKPERVGQMSNEQVLLYGPPISAIDRIKLFSPTDFENFVLEWIDGYLTKEYYNVWRCGGAGDKGRDVVAYIDEPGSSIYPKWNNYQCKHYDSPLSPSEFEVELGKLCYFTYTNEYTIPYRYYLIASSGIGPKLSLLLENPNKLRQDVIENWDTRCAKKIIKNNSISLEGEFARYVENFDFSIVKYVSELEVINQHRLTKWHALRFGGGLTRLRPPTPIPDTLIGSKETRYVQQLFEAYSDHLKKPVTSINDLRMEGKMSDHFNRQRQCFYSAEALKEFERDTLPDNSAFEGLKEEVYQGVVDVCEMKYDDGFACVVATTTEAQHIQIRSNVLTSHIKVQDCKGICHHLANEDRLKWVK